MQLTSDAHILALTPGHAPRPPSFAAAGADAEAKAKAPPIKRSMGASAIGAAQDGSRCSTALISSMSSSSVAFILPREKEFCSTP